MRARPSASASRPSGTTERRRRANAGSTVFISISSRGVAPSPALHHPAGAAPVGGRGVCHHLTTQREDRGTAQLACTPAASVQTPSPSPRIPPSSHQLMPLQTSSREVAARQCLTLRAATEALGRLPAVTSHTPLQCYPAGCCCCTHRTARAAARCRGQSFRVATDSLWLSAGSHSGGGARCRRAARRASARQRRLGYERVLLLARDCVLSTGATCVRQACLMGRAARRATWGIAHGQSWLTDGN